MKQIILLLLTGLLFSVPAWGQESQSEEQETGEPESAEQAEPEEDPLAVLDEQGYEDEDEDDFVPTEEIPYDQDIPFPTDI